MPYHRVIRQQTPLAEWHELSLLEPQAAWSDAYRPASARLLLPRSDCIEFELHGRRFLCDSLGAVWLTPDATYRMRQPRKGKRSMVLVVHEPQAKRGAAEVNLSAQALLVFARWAALLRTGALDALAFDEDVAALMQVVGGQPHPSPRANHAAVERARALLSADPASAANLAQIALAACSSPFHLAREFRRQTGSSLHAYRTRLRMALAVDRIAEGERNFSALAADLGYSSHSHFSAVFRRTFGAAPGQVRTNLTARRHR